MRSPANFTPATPDTKLFANDLIQTVKYKSYVPGAPPPPKTQPAPVATSSFGSLNPNAAPFPTGPAAGSLKRGFHDRADFDAPNGREHFQGGGRPMKQARRGGGYGRRGYVDPDAPQPVQQLQYDYPSQLGQNVPPFPPMGMAGGIPNFLGTSDPAEAIRQLRQLNEQLGQQIGQHMAQFGGPAQQGFASHRGPQKKRGRCRDYDTKGYCARGPNCKFEHSNGDESTYNLPAPQNSGQIQMAPEGRLRFDSYDPTGGETSFAPNLLLSFPYNLDPLTFCNPLGTPFLTHPAEYDPTKATMTGPPMPQFKQQQQFGGQAKHRRDSRQAQNQRRAGPARAPFSASGPVHDKTQTKVVVESIPEENFEESQVREFFSQYGNIEEVTMMPYKRLAVIKYDTWAAANAAYKSPKVIFDNRFVKVFWYKDEKHAELGQDDAKQSRNHFASGNGPGHATAEGQEEGVDMEEFTRKQEEAQKAYEEKTRKAKELAEKRAELEKKAKELQAKHEAEKQRLLQKLAKSGKEPSDSATNGTSTETKGEDASKSSSQTEALRATLARLQEEAKAFGLDPHAQAEDDTTISTYSARGRGGSYRGRGGYAPRASFRGGRGGRGNIHAAYAAFSLDNRPKKVSMSGVDFSAPEKDEVLRQHLFVSLTQQRGITRQGENADQDSLQSLGEFAAEIQVTPAVTHISFNNRAAAEKFYASIRDKTLPGLSEGEQLELAWVANTAGPLPGSSTHKVDLTRTSADDQSNGAADADGDGAAATAPEGDDALMADAGSGAHGQNGGASSGVQGQGQQEGGTAAGGEEDYDVAGENEWDMD